MTPEPSRTLSPSRTVSLTLPSSPEPTYSPNETQTPKPGQFERDYSKIVNLWDVLIPATAYEDTSKNTFFNLRLEVIFALIGTAML
eukprot:gene17842-5612_t